MRIAWVCPYLPAPENSGGRIRISSLVRAFAQDELHLYARFAEDDPPRDEIRPEKLPPWRSIHGSCARWPRFTRPITPLLPLSFPREVLDLLGEDDSRHPFDAVIVEHCYSAHWLPRLRRAAVVLSEHNVESEYFRKAVRSRPRQALKNALEFLRWRRYEAKIWRRADAITVVSERDRNRVHGVRPDSGIVVPNGVAIERYRFIPASRRSGNAILFVGLLSYQPNVDAAKLLATEVLPLVRRRIPDATLTIAGRDPLSNVRALESPSVRITGTVPNIAALYDEHADFANPGTVGGGSSLTVLEALATGLPLVCSPFAARGYGLESERHYISASSPREVAGALCRVLERRSELDGLAERGRRIAEAHAWNELAERFHGVVRGAVEARRTRS